MFWLIITLGFLAFLLLLFGAVYLFSIVMNANQK